MKIEKRKAALITGSILILGIMLNFLFGIMPDNFKDTVSGFANGLGVPYSLFWILVTSVIIIITLIFVWKQALTNNEKQETSTKTVFKGKGRQINMGPESKYIEKNNGDINVN